MIVLFDDTNLSLVPAAAGAVAGYVNGRWPTEAEAERRWPKAKHLSIAVTSHADADVLDVEPGDATNAVAANWVKRQLGRKLHTPKPVVYTSASNAEALIKALAVGGVARSQYWLWTAHYTHHEHLCGPSCGFGDFHADATQWTDRALGRSLDESIARDDFFSAPPLPKPKPPRPGKKPTVSHPPSTLTIKNLNVPPAGPVEVIGPEGGVIIREGSMLRVQEELPALLRRFPTGLTIRKA